MIRLLTTRARIALIATAMTVAIPTITFAQTSGTATESEPAAGGNTSPVQDTSGTEDDTSVETDPPARSATAANHPEKANQAVESVRENPEASLIDKTIAHAVSLQQQGKRDDAIEKWRAIAHIAEGSDNDLAARSWLSIGYLAWVESSEDCILAHDEAIRLKPDYAAAYTNRGNAKAALGRHDDAIADRVPHGSRPPVKPYRPLRGFPSLAKACPWLPAL